MRRLLLVLRRRIVLMVVLVVAGLAAAYLGTSRTAVYETHTTLYVGQSGTNLLPATEYAQAVLAQTFALIVPTPSVVSGAIAAGHIPRSEAEVIKSVTAVATPGTNLITITVRDGDPLVAQSLANDIASVFVNAAEKLAPLTGAATGLSADKAPASVAQTAPVPGMPLATGLARNVALGGVAGLLVGIVLVLLLDFLGLSARSPRQLESQMDLPILGIVPQASGLARASEAGGEAGPGNLLLVGDDG